MRKTVKRFNTKPNAQNTMATVHRIFLNVPALGLQNAATNARNNELITMLVNIGAVIRASLLLGSERFCSVGYNPEIFTDYRVVFARLPHTSPRIQYLELYFQSKGYE